MAASRVAALEAEIARIDAARAKLIRRITTHEEQRSSLQQDADAANSEKQPLLAERRQLLASPESPEAQPAAKKARTAKQPPSALPSQAPTMPKRGPGRQSKDRLAGEAAAAEAAAAAAEAAEPAAAPAAATGSVAGGGKKAKATAPAAERGRPAPKPTAPSQADSTADSTADSAAGTVVHGSIVVPSVAQALAASSDEDLFCPTFMLPPFREKELCKHEAAPGSDGSLAYLVSLNAARESGVDGFIMWKVHRGRRNLCDVELLCLSYLRADEDDKAMAVTMLDGMLAWLAKNKTGGAIRNRLSEKARKWEHGYWKSLGFRGVAGADDVSRDL
jgi:hypothetical protein